MHLGDLIIFMYAYLFPKVYFLRDPLRIQGSFKNIFVRILLIGITTQLPPRVAGIPH